MTETGKKALELAQSAKGKIAISIKVPFNTPEDASLAYTPGVAEVAMACAINGENAYIYTIKQNAVAIVSDGSSVLGLGNIGPLGAQPVMEGKAMLYKRFVDIDAFPLCLATQDTQEIVQTVKNIAPSFGGIHLEDIAAPRCFEVEEKLSEIGIPVMHDDQHGTAVVVRAALLNAAKVVGKPFTSLKVVISGGGAAGQATARILQCDDAQATSCDPVSDVIVVDSKGIIVKGRENQDPYKEHIAQITNKEGKTGDLAEALEDADAFIGLSRGNIVTADMVKTMAKDPIVFALSNPEPEIHPEKAREGGAKVIATGRSDFPNQVNNSLGFPGLFKAALEMRTQNITFAMKIAVSNALAGAVEHPTAESIIPSIFQEGLFTKVVEAVKAAK